MSTGELLAEALRLTRVDRARVAEELLPVRWSRIRTIRCFVAVIVLGVGSNPRRFKRFSRLALAAMALAFLCETFRPADAHSDPPRVGICQREAAAIVGVTPVQVGKSTRTPKKTHNVSPRYPELPAGTRGNGIWAGEVLLDANGRVSRVWVTREVRLTPSFPPFNQAIVDAIREWRFERLLVNGRSMPACMNVTVTIDWS